MIPYEPPKLPQWKPVVFEGRWHVYRNHPTGMQRSIESFGNRSTALVVAETLNGEERARFERTFKQVLR